MKTRKLVIITTDGMIVYSMNTEGFLHWANVGHYKVVSVDVYEEDERNEQQVPNT